MNISALHCMISDKKKPWPQLIICFVFSGYSTLQFYTKWAALSSSAALQLEKDRSIHSIGPRYNSRKTALWPTPFSSHLIEPYFPLLPTDIHSQLSRLSGGREDLCEDLLPAEEEEDDDDEEEDAVTESDEGEDEEVTAEHDLCVFCAKRSCHFAVLTACSNNAVFAWCIH